MSDYTLYSHRNSYAMSVHLMLEELGVDYDIVLFNVHVESELPEEFLQLNPNARVPTLVTADGPIYESAAILVHLSEKHGGRFMPTFSDPLRGKFWQWLFYLMSTMQPEVLIQFHPERYFPDDRTMQQALCKASLLELDKIWFIIDDALRPGPYFLAEKYSVCDMLFAMQALWTENQPADLSAYTNTVKLMEQVFKRPAARKILQAHSIEHLALF